MHHITDLHLHSKHSRACSKHLTLENLEKWCEYKGIHILGCSDFTHPEWNKEINTKLEETSSGLYKLKGSTSKVRFLMTTEISMIYKQGDKCRRVHICLYVPNIETVNKITKELGKRGNIKSDGRPILGITCKELAEIALTAHEKSLVVPAHIWTPWFSIFGSKSGFDTVEEAFGEYEKYIYAIETGLSSSVPMNWMVSQLDNRLLLSNSDAHSLQNLGREANVFDLEDPSYDEIYDIIRYQKIEKFPYSINFFPQEGKYHLDGCANCELRMEPEETQTYKGRCPSCKKNITVGVLSRVHDLADRNYGEKPEKWVPYKNIVPLQEIISEALGRGKNTKTVQNEYFEMVKHAGEFELLIHTTKEQLSKITTKKIVEGIMKVREEDVVVLGGYDGIFGTVQVWHQQELETQKSLFS